MKLEGSKGFRAAHLIVIGVVAAALGWGANQVAVWQLERRAPDPDPRAERPKAQHSDEPVVDVAEDLVVAESVEAEELDQRDEPADDTARPAVAPKAPAAPGAKRKAARKPPAPDQDRATKPPPSPAVRVFALDKDKLTERFKKPADLAGHGHVLPHAADGARRGMRFVDVAPNGLFARLGIRSGDVILSINDAQMTTQQKVMSDLEKMRHMRTFNVILERDGQIRHHRYVLR